MKNYREFINIAIFSGSDLIVSIDGDKIKFEDAHVFLYRDNVIVAHFPKCVWDKAILNAKWTDERAKESVFYLNYWIDF